MGLEDILKKIKQNNQNDIELINKEAEEKCKEINKETQAIIQELKEKNRRTAQLEAEKLKEYLLQEARIKAAKEILKTKSDILNIVFNEALKKLENLPAEEYMAWIEKTVFQVIEPGENEIVFPARLKQTLALEEFLKQINEKLKNKGSIKIAENKEGMAGGFILKRPKKETNCSFKSLLEEKRNNLKIKISKLLFANT